jgi:hypothetical protein
MILKIGFDFENWVCVCVCVISLFPANIASVHLSFVTIRKLNTIYKIGYDFENLV